RARVLSRIPHTAPARPRVVEVVAVDPEDGSAEARNVDGPRLTVRLAPEAARNIAVGDRVLVRVRHRGREAWGEVMRKLGRPQAALLGMVERAGGRGLVLRASDKRLREEFLLTKLNGAMPGDLVRARISSERRAGRPLAEVIER